MFLRLPAILHAARAALTTTAGITAVPTLVVPARRQFRLGLHLSQCHRLASSTPFSSAPPPPPPSTASTSASTSASQYDGRYLTPHPRWTQEQLLAVSPDWPAPTNMRERVARLAIRIIRFNFDLLTGFMFKPTEARWLSRMIFLETIAGVPGFCGAAIRHLRSLRAMERDRGWIHSLVGEAENERMHLLTFLEIRKPSWFMSLMVALSQAVFWNFYFVSFLLSPKFSFALVSSLEIQAVKTYTHCLEEIEHGTLRHWKTIPAPEIAVNYWNLSKDATLKEMIYHIRADEAHHRHCNHVFSTLEPYKDANPFDI